MSRQIDTHMLVDTFILVDDSGHCHITDELSKEVMAEAGMVMQVVYCKESSFATTKVLKNKWGMA